MSETRTSTNEIIKKAIMQDKVDSAANLEEKLKAEIELMEYQKKSQTIADISKILKCLLKHVNEENCNHTIYEVFDLERLENK